MNDFIYDFHTQILRSLACKNRINPAGLEYLKCYYTYQLVKNTPPDSIVKELSDAGFSRDMVNSVFLGIQVKAEQDLKKVNLWPLIKALNKKTG